MDATRRTRGFADYLLAGALLFALNWLVPIEPDVLDRNFLAAVRHRVERFRGSRIDLVILGDSRAEPIDAALLCTRLGIDPKGCTNAALMGGDWVTAVAMIERLQGLVRRDTRVVLSVSEFWLESSASEHYSAVALPTYARLGQYGLMLAARVPLSYERGRRVDALRTWAERVARLSLGIHAFPPAPAADAAGPDGLSRGDVDFWFPPIDDNDVRERRRLAVRALGRLKSLCPRVAVVLLPNPAVREAYVDRRYPGRRARFRRTLASATTKAGVPLVDLAGEIAQSEMYRDFQHLTPRGGTIATELLAERLAPILRARAVRP